MKVARWIFGIAGIYGIVGITLAWQVVFLMIAREPARYRPLMLASVLEKLAWGVAAIVLFRQQRVSGMTLGFGGIDLLLGALFIVAFLLARRTGASA